MQRPDRQQAIRQLRSWLRFSRSQTGRSQSTRHRIANGWSPYPGDLGLPSRGRPPHNNDLAPAFTASFSVFPALNVGDVDSDMDTASPVLGLRPVGADLLLVTKVATPTASSPSSCRI